MDVANHLHRLLFHTTGDRRVGEWWLMGGPGPLLALLGLYWLLVSRLLPALMRHQPPFKLTALLTTYNSVQMVACIWIAHQTILAIKKNHHSFVVCSAVNYSEEPHAVRLAEMCWWYLMLKLADLVETVFFVLRKKEAQVSPLHLYHHISTPICAWIMIKFAAGGTPSVYMVMNCGVHVVMYLYYLFTGLGLSKPLVLWKRYLTMLQMAQFCAVILHAAQAFVVHECQYHKLLASFFISNVAFVYYMFSGFYTRAYQPQARPKLHPMRCKYTKH